MKNYVYIVNELNFELAFKKLFKMYEYLDILDKIRSLKKTHNYLLYLNRRDVSTLSISIIALNFLF